MNDKKSPDTAREQRMELPGGYYLKGRCICGTYPQDYPIVGLRGTSFTVMKGYAGHMQSVRDFLAAMTAPTAGANALDVACKIQTAITTARHGDDIPKYTLQELAALIQAYGEDQYLVGLRESYAITKPQITELEAEVKRIRALEAAAAGTGVREALTNAREKLKLYRAQHSGEYIGGMEYTSLIRQIDAALTTLTPVRGEQGEVPSLETIMGGGE